MMIGSTSQNDGAIDKGAEKDEWGDSPENSSIQQTSHINLDNRQNSHQNGSNLNKQNEVTHDADRLDDSCPRFFLL